jgi:hypothetical protein
MSDPTVVKVEPPVATTLDLCRADRARLIAERDALARTIERLKSDLEAEKRVAHNTRVRDRGQILELLKAVADAEEAIGAMESILWYGPQMSKGWAALERFRNRSKPQQEAT